MGGGGVTAELETGATRRWESCTLVSQVVVGVGSERCKKCVSWKVEGKSVINVVVVVVVFTSLFCPAG